MGTDDNQAENAEGQYRKLASATWTPGISAGDARAIFTRMTQLKTELDGTSRAMAAEQHSHAMVDLVARTNKEYKLECRLASFAHGEPAKVASTLEGIVGTLALTESEQPEQKSVPGGLNAMMAALGATEAEVMAMLVSARSGGRDRRGGTRTGPPPPECDDCGVKHPGACFAKMLADGKTPSGWSSKPADMRRRIEERAKEIKDLGPYKDRKDPPMVAIVNPVVSAEKPVALAAAPRAPRSTFGIHIDSKGGAGHPFHFIADAELFVHKSTCPAVTVGGIGGNCVTAQEIGWCRVYDPESKIARCFGGQCGDPIMRRSTTEGAKTQVVGQAELFPASPRRSSGATSSRRGSSYGSLTTMPRDSASSRAVPRPRNRPGWPRDSGKAKSAVSPTRGSNASRLQATGATTHPAARSQPRYSASPLP